MKPATLLRWYPRAWRERYGSELAALIQVAAVGSAARMRCAVLESMP